MFVLARKEEQLTWASFILESQPDESKTEKDNTESELRESEIESLKRKNKDLQKNIAAMKKQLHASEEFDRLELDLESARLNNRILQEKVESLNKQLQKSQGLVLELEKAKSQNAYLIKNNESLVERLQHSTDSYSELLNQKQKIVKTFSIALLAIIVGVGAILYSQQSEITRLQKQLSTSGSKAVHTTSSPKLQTSSISSASSTPSKSSSVMVWIPRTGKKYHKKSTCSNMVSPSQVTLSEAKERGYTPCSKCDPPR